MPARFGQTVAGFVPESLPNHAVNILRSGSPPAPIAILRSASGLPGINTSSPPLPAFILLPFFPGLKKKPTRVAWKKFSEPPWSVYPAPCFIYPPPNFSILRIPLLFQESLDGPHKQSAILLFLELAYTANPAEFLHGTGLRVGHLTQRGITHDDIGRYPLLSGQFHT